MLEAGHDAPVYPRDGIDVMTEITVKLDKGDGPRLEFRDRIPRPEDVRDLTSDLSAARSELRDRAERANKILDTLDQFSDEYLALEERAKVAPKWPGKMRGLGLVYSVAMGAERQIMETWGNHLVYGGLDPSVLISLLRNLSTFYEYQVFLDKHGSARPVETGRRLE
jgi:hypothetical protein